MAKKFWTVKYTFDTYADARAFRDRNGTGGIIEEGKRRSLIDKKQSRTRLGKIVLGMMVPGRVYHYEDFVSRIVDAGYQASSINALMSSMTAEGAVLRVGSGQYVKR